MAKILQNLLIFFRNYYRNNSLKILLSLLFFSFALLIFAAITEEVILEKEETVDFIIFHIFQDYIIRERLTGFMFDLTQFSSISLMTFVYPSLILVLFLFKRYRRAIFAVLAGGGGLLLIHVMKIFFERPRPPYPLLIKEESFSFPSGHATFSFIFYGTLAYFVWLTHIPKHWKYLAITFLIMLSLAIGFSRIYLRVHYLSDVLGGFCLGYSWLFLLIYTFRRFMPLDQ